MSVGGADVTGDLDIRTNIGDITLGTTTVNGILNLTTTDGDLTLAADTSTVTFGEDWDETKSALNIGGNIGTADRFFHVNILTDDQGKVQPLTITNAAGIYLMQNTGIETDLPGLPHNGRTENGSDKADHDEATGDLGEFDGIFNIEIPTQTPAELAQQLANGQLTEVALWALIGEKLFSQEIQELLSITDESVDAAVSALDAISNQEMKDLADMLNLNLQAPELTVLTQEAAKGMTLEALLDKAEGLGIALNTSSRETIISAIAAQQTDDIKAYRAAVETAYRTRITDTLSEEDYLTADQVSFLMNQGLTTQEDYMVTLLAAAIEARAQRVDENGNKLYINADGEETTESSDEEGNAYQPSYEQTTIMVDETELFPAYWNSLTEEQKQELLEKAWAEAQYPDFEDTTTAPRELVLNIGNSTGSSYLVNVGDITIRQENGTFTAGEVVSTHGQVTIEASNMEGTALEDKTPVSDSRVAALYNAHFVGTDAANANIYADGIYLTATGSIGKTADVITQQVHWNEGVIGNITGESTPEFGLYDVNDPASWQILRNSATGRIEMVFEMDYTAIRDRLENAGSELIVSAGGDIAITEARGSLSADSVVSTGGSISLGAQGDVLVNHVQAPAGNVSLTSQTGSILDDRSETDTTPNVVASGNAQMTAISGTIGADAQPISVQVGGTLTVQNQGDVNLVSDEKLNLVADSDGQLNITVEDNLNISSTEKDITVGQVTASNVSIQSAGAVLAGDQGQSDAHVTGSTISISAQQGVGTNAQLTVNTGVDGWLKLTANNGSVDVQEVSGDLTVDTVQVTGGDVTLTTTDGDILAKNPDSLSAAAEAARALAQAQAQKQAYEDQLDVADRKLTLLQEQHDILTAAETVLNQAITIEQKAAQALEDANAIVQTLSDELRELYRDPNATEEEISDKEAELDQARQQVNTATQALREAQSDHSQALTNAAEAIRSADANTLGRVENLSEANNLEEAFDALNKRIDEQQEIRDDLKQSVTDAEAEVARSEAALEAAQNAVSEDGIQSTGDVNLILNSGDGVANVGTAGQALGIQAGGTLNISGGEGTQIGAITVKSTCDVTLGDVQESDSIQISALGNITTAPGKVIESGEASFTSMDGSIGTADAALLAKVDTLSAAAQQVFIENLQSVILDGVYGTDVDLDVKGNVSDTSSNTGIIGGSVNIQADGSVGTGENPLDVEVFGDLSITADSAEIRTQSDLVIDRSVTSGDTTITGAGDLNDTGANGSGLYADHLKITVDGAIGTPSNPLDYSIKHRVELNSGFASTYILEIRDPVMPYKTVLTDSTMGIQVLGFFAKDVKLVVSVDFRHDLCDICKSILSQRSDLLLEPIRLELTGEFFGPLVVRIPVGDAVADGTRLTVLICSDGEYRSCTAVVRNGYAEFITEVLGVIYLLNDLYDVTVSGKELVLQKRTETL